MKPSYLLLAALTMSLGSSLVACSGADATEEETDSSSQDELNGRSKTLTDADDGKTVTITEGTTLNVKLAANATTGYAWRVKSVDRTLGQPKITYKVNADSHVGGGGVTTLTWKTTGPLDLVGTHKVNLEYQRPWAETAPPADRFSFTVKIVKAGASIGQHEGQMCGGFANLPCASGLRCVFHAPPAGAAADMSGVCRAATE